MQFVCPKTLQKPSSCENKTSQHAVTYFFLHDEPVKKSDKERREEIQPSMHRRKGNQWHFRMDTAY